MADLDDFFAKKDRKKSKNVKKTVAADGSSRDDKLGDRSHLDGDERKSNMHDEDEWKEFEEEKKDYTGLKLGNLNINLDSGGLDGTGLDGDDGGSDNGSNGNPQGDYNKQKEVWKRAEQPPPPPPPKVEEAPAESNVKSGVYVAVHLRGNRLHSDNTHESSRARSKVAPDITNEEYFPTLSGGKPAEPTTQWNKSTPRPRIDVGFEEVRHGKGSSSRSAIDRQNQANAAAAQGPKLNLENRYNSLSTNES